MAEFLGKRFDANADKRWQLTLIHRAGQLGGGRECVAIFFLIGPAAVAIFKIDSIVLDGLAPELFTNALINGVREPGRVLLTLRVLWSGFDGPGESGNRFGGMWQLVRSPQTQCFCEGNEIGREFVEGSKREFPQLSRGA
jgi:hypothetical protein